MIRKLVWLLWFVAAHHVGTFPNHVTLPYSTIVEFLGLPKLVDKREQVGPVESARGELRSLDADFSWATGWREGSGRCGRRWWEAHAQVRCF